MTAVPIDSPPPPGGWSVDDLEGLPEDGHRRELLDGVLLMSPSPTDLHQDIAWRLAAALDATIPDGYRVTQAVEVRISQRRSFIPDVLVVVSRGADRPRGWYPPHEVAIAVEIVSQSSRAMDRITKPALYAQAGIPHYWRIETEDAVVVETFDLDLEHDIYVRTGRWTEVVKLSQPWPLEVSIDQLLPRELRKG
jgi:Uma2 family endonuclease